MSGDTIRWIYIVCIALYGLWAYWRLTEAISRGRPWLAVLWCWLASPFPLLFIATVIERRPLLKLIDPVVQSWAFLFGDFVFLPFMAAMLALAWRRIDGVWDAGQGTWRQQDFNGVRPWYRDPGWRVISAAFGVSAGLMFHLLDSGNYTTLAANSPAKLFHDLVSYSVLWAGLWFGAWAALIRRASRKLAYLALCGLLFWVAGGVADNTIRRLDGRNMHVQYDWDTRQVIPYF